MTNQEIAQRGLVEVMNKIEKDFQLALFVYSTLGRRMIRCMTLTDTKTEDVMTTLEIIEDTLKTYQRLQNKEERKETIQ